MRVDKRYMGQRVLYHRTLHVCMTLDCQAASAKPGSANEANLSEEDANKVKEAKKAGWGCDS